jgi:hypothetical protein
LVTLVRRTRHKNTRSRVDWIASFLEKHVQPKLDSLRAATQREYLTIYAAWASDPVHRHAVYETEKCSRLSAIAEGQLQDIASPYDRGFLLNALRTMPLSALAWISRPSDRNELMDWLKIATIGVCRFARRTPPERIDIRNKTISRLVSPEELSYIEEHLAEDLARLIGAASCWVLGEVHHRLAGKGGKLEKPELVPPEAWKVFDNYPPSGPVVLPRPTSVLNPAVEKAVRDYDARRVRGASLGVAGGLLPERQLQPLNSTKGWWGLTLSGDPAEPHLTQVNYPELNLLVRTSSYLPVPYDAVRYLSLLEPFAAEFPRCFGIDFQSFVALCESLFCHIVFQTAYDALEVMEFTDQKTVLTSKLKNSDPRCSTAPGFLYDLFAKGAIRARREAFVARFVRDLAAGGHRDAEISARRFIEIFSNHADFGESLTPWLFFEIDDRMLMLDFLPMAEFFERCLKVVTSGDGEIGNSRGALFEEAARARIVSGLKLDPATLPVKPNTCVRYEGRNYGDVDFAFVWNGILINLDMKSWQRTPEYFRGDYNAIRNRQAKLVEILVEKVSPRGEKLRELLLGWKPNLELLGTLSFLCVADVEYVSPDQPALWYGGTPRVLTPNELVESLHDQNRIESVLSAAGLRTVAS